MVRENKLTAFMLVQQFNEEYFKWTEKEKKAIKEKDIKKIAKIVKERLLNETTDRIEECHIVLHDKDTQEVWDDTHKEYVIEYKVEHFHCLVKFKKDEGMTIKEIAMRLGVAEEYIEKPKRGRYAYDNMLAYLTHIKYPDKFQYDADDVFSTDKPYKEYYALRRKEWLAGRAKVKTEKAKMSIETLEENILLGHITRNQILLTDDLYDVYARNKRRCDDALDTYADRKVAQTVQKMENGEFKVSVFFITGKSGSGKSTFTDNFVKHLQEKIQEENGVTWSVCQVASNNPLDEYRGDEILVMDDLRGVSLTASDWLKLLDPDRINMGSARYKNKKMACRVIVINSEKDVLDFFYFLKGNTGGDRSESMDQFFRRILARVQVIKADNERYVEIGYSQEVNPYTMLKPDSKAYGFSDKTLTVTRDFNKDKAEYDCDEAIEKLADDVVLRNNDVKGETKERRKREKKKKENQDNSDDMSAPFVVDFDDSGLPFA